MKIAQRRQVRTSAPLQAARDRYQAGAAMKWRDPLGGTAPVEPGVFAHYAISISANWLACSLGTSAATHC